MTPDGRRVVSAANIARTHRPGVDVPPGALNLLPAALLPETTAMSYCLGWFDQTFKDGRHQLWHAGGIDGFGSLMGFFPEDRLGFVVLTNLEPASAGLFNISVQSSLLSRLYGLNEELPAFLADAAAAGARSQAELAARTRPVERNRVAPYLGLYSQGFNLRRNDRDELHLEHDIRTAPILALDDGGYLVAGGPGSVVGRPVTFATDGDGNRTMTIEGYEPARLLTGDQRPVRWLTDDD